MKWISWVPALLLLVSCTTASDHLRSTFDEVNVSAFNGEIKAEICYCNRHIHPECWKHHGLFVSGPPVQIHIAPEWYWEPDIYYRGVIAHELIHAFLFITNQEGSESHPHSWRFRRERERVAKALDIPVWAIPDGVHEDKLDATRTMAHLEKSFNAMRDRVHGLPVASPSTAGWPTQLYDPEE